MPTFPAPVADFVAQNKLSGETDKSFFMRVVSRPKLCEDFLKIIFQNPRDNRAVFKAVRALFKTSAEKLRFLNKYNEVYGKYFSKVWKKAKAPEDVVKLRPNLTPWALEGKFGDFSLGTVPKEFGSTADFYAFVHAVRNSSAMKNYKQIKRLEAHPKELKATYAAFRKIDFGSIGQKKKALTEVLLQKCGRPFKVTMAGRVFQVRFLCNPFSHKAVFSVATTEGKKYILKMLPYNFVKVTSDRVRKEHENMALRGDSTYADALLEFYLKLNQCPHAPLICFYNFKQEVALYEVAKSTPCVLKNKKADVRAMYDFNVKRVADANALGVYINDVVADNFVQTARGVKIIDIGHASFYMPLMPDVPGLTCHLGNLCGKDLFSLLAEYDLL
ncbi:MAG: hypothetical protein ILP11_02865 [Alphaproteobacteria bacterium]|nr:hypothetical protein [Alphaproteobacteria bacterium]